MRGNGKEMNNNLERAIKHYNISRDILNNLLDKKLKKHSQNYEEVYLTIYNYHWIRKGILTSQITRLAHQRNSLHIRTLIDALKKM
jgi:hypothetical protein